MAAISAGRRLVGSVLFVAALNHKQMSLFFAPAFFAHLLGWALHDPAHTGLGRKVGRGWRVAGGDGYGGYKGHAHTVLRCKVGDGWSSTVLVLVGSKALRTRGCAGKYSG